MEVAEVGASGGKKVTRSLPRNECLRPLLCLLFALPIRRDKLISHGVIDRHSLETASVEYVLCTCRG